MIGGDHEGPGLGEHREPVLAALEDDLLAAAEEVPRVAHGVAPLLLGLYAIRLSGAPAHRPRAGALR